jgi:ABC-type uncharacterized transport system auxiliary subunit
MKIQKGALAVALISCLVLAGCNEKAGSNTASTQDSSVQADNSLNNYIAMNNDLMGLSGLQASYEAYVRLNIPKAKPSQSLGYPSATFKYTFSQYAEAIKGKRSRPALDQAADDLMKKLEAVKSDTAVFEQYYESASYKTDALKKGKEADAQIRQHFEDALASYSAFAKELDVVYQQAKLKELEVLKQSGNNYQYRKAYSMHLAEQLVSVFDSQEDLTNADKLKQADKIADQLGQELSEFNAEYQKIKDKNPQVSSDSTLMSLNSCIKYYRSFKESKSQYDFKFMIDGYNNAVRANR